VAAALRGAVDAIFGGIFLILPVPEFLESDIKELVNMLQRNVVSHATFRRHMRRILDRHLENAFEAVMAHPMPTA
jgi:hypothetical protein